MTKAFRSTPSAGGSNVTPSVSLANGVGGGTVTVNSEGTVDWLAFLADYFSARPVASTSAAKAKGLWLMHSFETLASTGSAAGHNNTAPSGSPVTVVLAAPNGNDNVGGGTFSTQLHYNLFSASAAQNEYGFTWKFPACPTTRYLRAYMTAFNCTVNVSASLTSGVSAVDSFVIGAVQTQKKLTCTFAGNYGEELTMSVRIANSSNGSIGMGVITVGTV